MWPASFTISSRPGALDAVVPHGVGGRPAFLNRPVDRLPVHDEAIDHLAAAKLLVVQLKCSPG
ncbi:hypothetical protein AB0M31_03830 [Streptomyces sp. NPDC051773]|uniref:hypothetical protein n=1 Tax=Streptomyces sp. NPDC051773 TaxID=3156682 RepID=UPI0034467CA2